jgi:serine/threonine protein kinase
MAPEIASHQSYNVSADVYSWAMVSYEIFMLEKPFHGWTRDMHSSHVCGRGARPDISLLSSPVRSMLEVCWSQCAFHRPSMKDVEQRMKILEQQQLMSVCGNKANGIAVELPEDFNCGVRKMPNRNVSESQTAATTSLSTESLASFIYP